MKQLKIVNGFAEMTDANLLVKTHFILTSMTGNTNFPDPSPALNAVSSIYTAFIAAVQKAEGGNRQDIAAKNATRQSLIDNLHRLGNYVLFASDGDDLKATSSGYGIGKIPAPTPPLDTPQGLKLANGVNKGELKLRFQKVYGARSYRYDITPSPITENSVWESSTNTITKKQYSGLESGKEYNCRVVAYGIKEQVVYSDVVSRVVL